jgi:hypothetical protein
MKKIFFAIGLVILLPASALLASYDSVAVFHRSEKVVVLINEQDQGRLQAWMNHVGDEEDMLIEAPDKSIRLNCGRNREAATCTFTFLPSEFVQIGNNKTLYVEIPLEALRLPHLTAFEMKFQSSREDRFVLNIENDKLLVRATKRVL